MSTSFKSRHNGHALLGVSLTLASCGSFADDTERYDELTRLRVLAVRSEPADLAFGETATLSALVFEPKDRDVSYEWSWCPSRADSTGGFECAITESDLAEAWDSMELPGAPPSYDLGTEPEAQFTNLMAPELVAALCQSLIGGSDVSQELTEQLALACFMGLEASIQVKVRTSKEEITAIKSMSLLTMAVPDAQRNLNPQLDFAFEAEDQEDDSDIEGDDALRAGRTYKLHADLDDDTAQEFTPSSPMLPGAESETEPEEPRRETLIASWFVTIGDIVAAKKDDPFGGDPHTTFVDGHNDFDALLDNGWKLPLTADGEAQIYFVVRDERGGVGWTQRKFNVEGGK